MPDLYNSGPRQQQQLVFLISERNKVENNESKPTVELNNMHLISH